MSFNMAKFVFFREGNSTFHSEDHYCDIGISGRAKCSSRVPKKVWIKLVKWIRGLVKNINVFFY